MLTREEVKDKLHSSEVSVRFIKSNGEVREMRATLSEAFLPENDTTTAETRKRKPNPDVMAVWDIQKNAFRSFRWDSVRLVDGEETPNGL